MRSIDASQLRLDRGGGAFAPLHTWGTLAGTLPAGRRAKLRILAAILLLIGLSQTGSVADDGSLQSQDNPALSVMSYNIMWEEDGVRAGNLSLPVWQERRPLVRKIIEQHRPDLIGLQEASPEQQVGLAEDNPEYGILYDHELNNTNPILYRTSRFNVTSSGAFVLNDVPEQPGTNIGVRKASFARLIDRRTGHPLTLFNIHLDARGDGSTRRLSAVRLATSMAAEKGPVLLTGDFNCRRPSPTMQFFVGAQPLADDEGNTQRSPRPLVDALGPADPGHNLIDFVLVDQRFQIQSAQQVRDVDRRASDHFPVLVVVSPEEPEDTHDLPGKE